MLFDLKYIMVCTFFIWQNIHNKDHEHKAKKRKTLTKKGKFNKFLILSLGEEREGMVTIINPVYIVYINLSHQVVSRHQSLQNPTTTKKGHSVWFYKIYSCSLPDSLNKKWNTNSNSKGINKFHKRINQNISPKYDKLDKIYNCWQLICKMHH